MRLSSVYLWEKLSEKYQISEKGNLSGKDGYLRPFLIYRKKNQEYGVKPGHLYILREADSEEILEELLWTEDVFLILCSFPSDEKTVQTTVVTENSFIRLQVKDASEMIEILNDLQQVFDRCEEWEEKLHRLMVENAGMERLLKVTSEFLQNPLEVVGLDFSPVAEAGMEDIPEKARIYNGNCINMEEINAFWQNEEFRAMEDIQEAVIFPAYINGLRSINRNLYVEGKTAHRLVMTECRTKISEGDICILEVLAEKLEFMLAHNTEETETRSGLEQIFLRLLSEKTADYIQVSQHLSGAGWSGNHEYLCLILQTTYVNHKNLSTNAICRFLKQHFQDSVSILYKEEIVTFFNLTKLNMTQEEVRTRLVYFIRDSYLKAGYSRTMEGHMNLRRQYVQAKTALDVGSRKKPYLWIHDFDQVVLPYMLEQMTRRLPGNMLCHEGLLKLQEQDKKNSTEYMQTLKVYLEQHLSATQSAKELFIHRSTFLYRIEKIKEILQSELLDPDEIFYLELSFRLLEQEEEKGE